MDKSEVMAIDQTAHHQAMSVVSKVPTKMGGIKKTTSLDGTLVDLAEVCPVEEKTESQTTWGRWTAAEHRAFLEGLKIHGREWKKVATCIPTRTAAQIRSHAQKYFAKVSKEKQQLQLSALQLQSLADDAVPMSSCETSCAVVGVRRSSQHSHVVQSVIENASTVELRVSKTLASLRNRYETLEAELTQKRASVLSDSASTDSPATLALELEQKSLREAAQARYELKRQERPPQTQPIHGFDTHKPSDIHRVSMASMPSSLGAFDSSQVLALSQVCTNLTEGSRTISTIKDEQRSASIQLIREQLMSHERPTKIRKTGHSSV
jgi:SHAQKYF class myb-like DNA-binding protein